ncbi:MAG: hypothetical protein HY290_08875 [Planctomycetia bacterium]|nr:hypothetical protein [Planctomycetia bacterium]
MLSWLGEYGFEYLKSHNEFRRTNKHAVSHIRISATTRNRSVYSLAFHLSVQIKEVEAWLLNLKGEKRKLKRRDQTIWNFTMNIGPGSPHWTCPMEGTWLFSSREDFDERSPDISAFVEKLALPFVIENQNPHIIRRTLIETPGRAQSLWPYESVLAIDYLYGSQSQAEADIDLLEKRYSGHIPRFRQRFHDFVQAFRMATKFQKGTQQDGRSG